MTIGDGEIVQAVVDFVSPGGLHQQNRFTYKCQFATGQSEATVVQTLNSELLELYGHVEDEIGASWSDPYLYVDEIYWDGQKWEVSANVGESQINITFLNADELLPLQTCAYLVGRTTKPRSRGRKWLPSFGEDQAGSGALVQQALSDLADAGAQYINTLDIGGGNSLVPGVASVRWGIFLPFTGCLVGTIVGTQRRRRQGYGI
jgi:hypothetical protein